MGARATRLCCLAAVFVFSTAGAEAPELSFKATALGGGLYMLAGDGGFAGGNIGLMIGDEAVILIDDGLPPLGERLLAAIAELADKPVDFVVNTHVHGDHVGGNQALSEAGAHIVAHDNLRTRMAGDGGEKPLKDELPVITFSDSVTFLFNGQRARVFHVPNAHTDGDAIIHFPETDVIHAGDVLFNGVFPFIDLDRGGSVDGFLAAQKRILSMAGDGTKIVPGHGPLATKRDLRAAIEMLEDARGRVVRLIEAGRSLDEVLEADPLAPYHEKWSWEFITTEKMTRALYAGLKGE